MKNLIYLSVIALFTSCGGSEETAENTDEKNENEQVIESPDSSWVEEIDSNEVDVFLEDLPNEWIMLTDESGDGENMVIYQYCEAETQSFHFEAGKGEQWQIYLLYGQDGEVCDISAFEATEKEEEENVMVVRGSFEYRATYDESNRFVQFWYNKDEMFGHFDGLGMGSEWFVPAKHKDNYETIAEDCEGLWE